jgi:hypothetical protein
MHVRVVVKNENKTLATWQRDYPDKQIFEKGVELPLETPVKLRSKLKGFKTVAVIKKFQKGMNGHAFLDLDAIPE